MGTGTRKIAIACFIGGALCCTVALMLAPVLWWLGLFAGLASGYLSYEFRAVLRAIPVAFRSAMHGGVDILLGIEDVVLRIVKYFRSPHPILYLSVLISTICTAILFSLQPTTLSTTLGLTFGFSFFVGIFSIVVSTAISVLTAIGAPRSKRVYYFDIMLNNKKSQPMEDELRSYKNVYHCFFRGIGRTVIFFSWTMWKYVAIGIWQTIHFFGRFGWHLFKLIHSDKRLLCGIDGALGGSISYFCFQAAATSTTQHVLFIVFGGFLGAVLGIANWEIVSKRLLHVEAK